MFDNTNQTLDIYRQFVDIHYELMPYFLNAGSTSMEEHIPVIYPQNERTILPPRDWAYILWTDILVNPIVENSTEVKVQFPAGNDWLDWWDTSIVYQGGETERLTYELESFPVFIRKGAALALQVTKDLNLNHGDEYSSDRLTVFIPWATESGKQVVRQFNDLSQELEYSYDKETRIFELTGTRHERSLIVVLHNIMEKPSSITDNVNELLVDEMVTIEEFRIANNVWRYDSETKSLWIRPNASTEGTFLTISN